MTLSNLVEVDERGASQMSSSEWDAIVVGSGPGGLTTAACLGAAGKRVLVLERHDVAGGNTQVFRRHHGDDWFEFDVGVHYVGEFGPNDFFNIEKGHFIPGMIHKV